MKITSPVNPVEQWKSALMTLPDSNFFELLRSVFGNIKTPFNKQNLMNDLFIFLSRDEIRKNIAAYINEQDHKIIAAVAFLNKPVSGDLEKFFSGEINAAELQALLVNLEERLIIYRFRESSAEAGSRASAQNEGVLRLALNPVLEPVLAPFIADSRPLFPSEKIAASGQNKAAGQSPELKNNTLRVNDARIMAALFTFILGEQEFFKSEKGMMVTSAGMTEAPALPGIRKKVSDDGKKFFPGLDLDLTVRILMLLGLFRIEGQSLKPNKERIADFSELSSRERQDFWAAGAYICLNENDPLAYTSSHSRSRIRRIASFIHQFRLFLNPQRKYPEITLRRYAELLGREDLGTRTIWGTSFFDGRVEIPFEPFLALMEKTGLLEKTEAYWTVSHCLHQLSDSSSDSSIESAQTEKPFIVMDTAFSLILYPEISFADAVDLAAFCSVKENSETAVSFEITRQSVVRGFDQGLNAAEMLKLLERLSLNRLDANLGWTLREWETRYTGVSLHQGVILALAEEQRYLAEAKPVASLIQQTLAPGVYLLTSADRAEAAKALLKTGVDIVAQPPFPEEKKKLLNTFPSLGSSGIPAPAGTDNTLPPPSFSGKEAEALQETFRKALEKMRLTKQERDELTARIERRLVLNETQLDKASLRYEKLEARGIDYQGKVVIAKYAIDAGSLLEVSWPGPGGEINNTIGIPQALEKMEKESILVIKSSSQGDTIRIPGNTLRIPLGKISLLRRIKQSIFGE